MIDTLLSVVLVAALWIVALRWSDYIADAWHPRDLVHVSAAAGCIIVLFVPTTRWGLVVWVAALVNLYAGVRALGIQAGSGRG
jgi:hypothetical protein